MERDEVINQKVYAVIEFLASSEEDYITSAQIGSRLLMSTRMVFRYMKEAQRLSGRGGYEILSRKSMGYRLVVVNEETFRHFLAGRSDMAGTVQERELAAKVIKKILITENCKLDDLADLFHYSRSSMSRVTARAGDLLEEYGLHLESKAYTGLYVRGDEIGIRDYMQHLWQDTESMGELWNQLELSSDYRAVEDWMDTWLQQEHLSAEPERKRDFFTYLGITLKRIEMGKTIEFGYLANLEELELLQRNFKDMSELLLRYYPPELLNGEIMYLALIRMQIFSTGSQQQPSEHNLIFFHDLVTEALDKIQQNYGVDLAGDEYLVNGLTMHVATNYSRYLLHMESENPFFEELQKNYPTAYYYSIELAEAITSYTRVNIPSNELGYLTLHFASCLERNSGVRRWKTAIIGSQAYGTALLLKSRLEKLYKSIEVTGIYPSDSMELIPGKMDFYILPAPADHHFPADKEMITLTPFLNQEDQERMAQLFQRLRALENSISIVNFCNPARFFIKEKALKKNALLQQLCESLRQQGCMTEEDEQALFSREALVSTEITYQTALPHCLIDGNSFISFVVLKKPVPWGKACVRLVILVCIQKGDSRFKEVMEKLFQIINDDEKVALLAESGDYEEFAGYLRLFEGGTPC